MKMFDREFSRDFAEVTALRGQERSLLNALDSYHPETLVHSRRVAIYSIDFALEQGFSHFPLVDIFHGALLHDIGKLKVPLEILNKTSALTEEEFAIVDNHPRLGYLMLEGIVNNNVRGIIVGHHEYKAKPYPRVDERRGEERRNSERLGERRTDERRDFVPIVEDSSQIVALADIYDALSSRRAYKEPLTNGEIMSIIEHDFKGKQEHVEMLKARLF